MAKKRAKPAAQLDPNSPDPIDAEDAAAGRLLEQSLGPKHPVAPPRPVPALVAALPIGSVFPSSLNPRRRVDQGALAELADSIVANGILQPILVRPLRDEHINGAAFEIICGERRASAVRLAITDRRLPPDYQIPTRVRECTDAELIILATTENLERADMDPLDEADAFAAIGKVIDRAPGERTAAAVARVTGLSERTVARRLALRDLAPETRQALEDGEINLGEAQAFALGDHDRQRQHLKRMNLHWERGADRVRESMTQSLVSVESPFFDRATYSGPIVEDEETGNAYFADHAQIRALFDAEIQKRLAALEAEWPWVDVVNGLHVNYADHESARDKRDKEAGAVLGIDRERFRLEVHAPMLRKETVRARAKAEKAKATGKAAPAAPGLTEAQAIAVKHAKTRAMRRAVANDPKAAVVLAILGLMGSREVFIRTNGTALPEQRVKPLEEDAQRRLVTLQPVVKALKGELAEGLDLGNVTDSEGEAMVYAALRRLELELLLRILAQLVSERVGSWYGYPAPRGPGDTPLAIAVAGAVGIARHLEATWRPDEAYFKAYSRAQLVALVLVNDLVTQLNRTGSEWSKLDKAKKGELVEACLDVPDGFWTPARFVELEFLGERQMHQALAKAAGAEPDKEEIDTDE
jgi:ParB family chromosome partitioning protein